MSRRQAKRQAFAHRVRHIRRRAAYWREFPVTISVDLGSPGGDMTVYAYVISHGGKLTVLPLRPGEPKSLI